MEMSNCHKLDTTLTKEELDAFGYLNWDNEVLGRAVKALAADLFKADVKGFEGIKTLAACYLLINITSEQNATDLTLKIDGYSSADKVGQSKWEVSIRKL